MKEIISKDNLVKDLIESQKVCASLLTSPHYRKMGAEGIYAIVEKSRAIGINPLEALNGGMYFVQGKVELSAAMMNQLIRTQRHSITKDKRSDNTICILHGKRADNGDTWVESFSIDDAKLAGIYKNQWLKYPKDMLFARALSRLARQLFPDVICGCYVTGEISDLPVSQNDFVSIDSNIVSQQISQEEVAVLDALIRDDDKYRQCVLNFIEKNFNSSELIALNRESYDKILAVATRKKAERDNKIINIQLGEQQQMSAQE